MHTVVLPHMLPELRVSGVFSARVSMVRRFSKWTACCSGVRPWKESFMSVLVPVEISGS